MAQKPTVGKWADEKTGEFHRRPSSFRNAISSASGAQYPPEAGRYHLYVSLACPWAHRTLIVRSLKGLESLISCTIVHWHMDKDGWRFARDGETDAPGAGKDPVFGAERLREVYYKCQPDYDGRITVPVLFDKKTKTIVNNESAEIIRMLYTEFDSLLEEPYKSLNFAPKELLSQIDSTNEWIYDNINNGVYKAGFATKQEPYEKAVKTLFENLDRVEAILRDRHADGHRYMLGSELTEVDIRLYTTIIRFDAVYVQHFKCNIGMIRYDYPHLHAWLKHLYWEIPGFKETTDFVHIKGHYTKSHPQINPYGITPVGPIPDILPM